MRVDHAILHILDFEGGGLALSSRELDLSDRTTRSYVQRHLRKVCASPESRHGEFRDGSPFAAELGRYLAQGGFTVFSRTVAERLHDDLRLCSDPEPCDLLVADFEADPDKPAAGAAPGEALPDGEDAAPAGPRCLALALLPRKQAFVHDRRDGPDGAFNEVARSDAGLPGPAQRLASYAVVEVGSLKVDFLDKERELAGSPTLVIPERLLGCTSEASAKEAILHVERIVEDVAQEYGANTAKAVSRAKAIVQERSSESEYLPPWELGCEVFEDEPRMRERFEEVAREEELPERVSVRRAAAAKLAKSHRIRTDTGIEITFPSEYSTNPDYIEFITEADGSMSIELKRIGSIENR